jgi:uncharacterized phiE125 gp8 family phage protein
MLIETVSIENWKAASVADVKSSARISHSAEDVLIGRWIDVATAYLEREYRVSILGRTLKLTLDRFGSVIELPKPPLRVAVGQPLKSAIQSISYRDVAGADQIIDLATVDMTKPDQCFHIVPAGDWPAVSSRAGAVSVAFDVGYAAADKVPVEIWQSVVLIAAYYVKHREATLEDPRITVIDRKLQFGVEALMGTYRVQRRMVEVA